MTIKELFKIKLPFMLALLIMVAAATGAEQIFLRAEKINNQTYNSVAAASQAPDLQIVRYWQNKITAQVALAQDDIPLIPEAKRLTFDDNYMVRYRVTAPGTKVANFYRQLLAFHGWQTASPASPNIRVEKLSIAYSENPISKKTDITYAYVPASTKVLGVQIAEADLSAPAPTESQPRQEPQVQPQPSEPQQPQPPQQPWQPQQPANNQPVDQIDFFRQPIQQPPQPISGGESSPQTCRVNGVDQPGSCEQYNNQTSSGGQAGQPGQMSQPNNQGPSEEDIKKMDERRFKDTKRGLTQFANQVKNMKKNFTRVKTSISKCGVGLPEDLNNALSQADGLIAKVNEAKTADELDEIMGDVQDLGSVMQDWGPRMGDLNRLCQMLKQADRDAKQFDRAVKRVESQAKANKKIDLSELINEYKAAVQTQKDVLAQAKELAKTDPESALGKIEDDFYGEMDNLGNLQMQIDALSNISKGVKDAAREITNFTSQLKTLARKKVDVAELQSLLGDYKTQLEEVKKLMNNKADVEELIAKVEETFDTRQSLQDGLQGLGILKTAPQISAGANYNVKVNIPDAFKKVQKEDNGEENEMEKIGL